MNQTLDATQYRTVAQTVRDKITSLEPERFRPVASEHLGRQQQEPLEPLHRNRWWRHNRWRMERRLHSRSSEHCSSGYELACSNELALDGSSYALRRRYQHKTSLRPQPQLPNQTYDSS